MTGSQLGPVAANISIFRPVLERRWSDLATLLLAQPNRSDLQVEEAVAAFFGQ